MKKFVFILSTMSIIFLNRLDAQNVGITAGAAFAKMEFVSSDGTISDNLKTNPTYRAGVEFENTLIKKTLYLQFSLLAAGKGVQSNDESIKYMLHYVEIPLQLKYKYNFNKRKHIGVFAAFGGYIAGGYAGKDRDDNKIVFGKEETKSDFKPLDFGIIPGAGFFAGPFQIAYNFDYGLANISNSTTGRTIKHRVHSISLNYFFGKE